MGTGGTGMHQRMRVSAPMTGGGNAGMRGGPYDNQYKQTSINVINLSHAGTRTLTQNPVDAGLLNGGTGSANPFVHPPPGFGGGGSGAAGAVFNLPPPGFSNLVAASGAQQLLGGGAGGGASGAGGLFPNLNLPPPVMNSLGSWSSAGLIAPGDAVIDPMTGQLTTLMEAAVAAGAGGGGGGGGGGRSPEST